MRAQLSAAEGNTQSGLATFFNRKRCPTFSSRRSVRLEALLSFVEKCAELLRRLDIRTPLRNSKEPGSSSPDRLIKLPPLLPSSFEPALPTACERPEGRLPGPEADQAVRKGGSWPEKQIKRPKRQVRGWKNRLRGRKGRLRARKEG